jgi:hypothetical protein
MNRDRIPRSGARCGLRVSRVRSTPEMTSPAPRGLPARLVLHGRPVELVGLEVLAERTGIHPQRIRDYVDYGLLEPSERAGEQLSFAPAAVPRLRRIERLRRDLGVNLTGIAIILDMRERLLRLRRELERREL